jgi:hypothetical protein
MTTLKLTHHHSSKDVVVNWDNVQFVADTESNLGDTYCEVAFEAGNALPVNQTAAEIGELLAAMNKN